MSSRSSKITVGSEIRSLIRGGLAKAPKWPPDVFAIAAYILKHSGAYHQVVSKWPPAAERSNRRWEFYIESVGKEWRSGKPGAWKCPKPVEAWWSKLGSYSEIALSDVCRHREICTILLQLLAVADEACNGFGIRGEDPADHAAVQAWALLAEKDTLCELIDPLKARVFPKLRTPQSGLTIRSLSHYLALIEGTEIQPKWWTPPNKHRDSLTLLLLPWPLELQRSQFEEAPSSLSNMPTKYGMFSYRAHSVPNIKARLQDAMDQAVSTVRTVLGEAATLDGIVLPELALTPDDYRRVSAVALESGRFLISGVAQPGPKAHEPGYNSVFIDVPDALGIRYSPEPQNKHHRWQLSRSQIERYGLQSQLDPDRIWWEATRLDRRVLTFIPMFDWLTMSVLICEDLARPDPVGDLLRSVGPNLVITLLMDGPQEPWRWASRYALALADDPGSSVLTFTSLGMTRLCGSRAARHKIALWKDYRDGRPQPIDLPEGGLGVVLYIKHEQREEWTADGRGDHAATSYPVLQVAIPVGAGDPVRYPI